ncbi:MAG: peptidase T [Prevotella sp.]|nr:peptidase T [Prevotella sp.]
MTLSERFIRYTRFDTQSDETSTTTPSTPGQLIFARHLRDELLNEGLSDVELTADGYLYATLPANGCDEAPVIGFISHCDTSPDARGSNVKARIVTAYDGGDIELRPGMMLSPTTFPELLAHRGEDIIVTDGTTLLGADDKAGIAEIVDAVCYLRDHPEIAHGKVRIAFTPDEEIGRGADGFDVERFGCQWAYTVDGGDLGELEYENFNAASALVSIAGLSVHPGAAKGKMINALRLACEYNAMIPSDETPETTADRQGFYHLTSMAGFVESAILGYIIRDHDRESFEKRKEFLRACVARLNASYGRQVATVKITDQYYNMKQQIDRHPHVVSLARQAMEACGVVPKEQPIRGGTDGAQLSFRGLPCPNLFAGGLNFHGPYEFVSIQTMLKARDVIVKLCELAAQ